MGHGVLYVILCMACRGRARAFDKFDLNKDRALRTEHSIDHRQGIYRAFSLSRLVAPDVPYLRYDS